MPKKIRESILGRSTQRKVRTPAVASRAEPLVTMHNGEERVVRFGDLLYYVMLSADAHPQDIEVRTAKVLLATSKRLTVTRGAGLSNTTWSTGGGVHLPTPQTILRTLFSLDEETALARHRKRIEDEIISAQKRLVQLQHNLTWCDARLEKIGRTSPEGCAPEAP